MTKFESTSRLALHAATSLVILYGSTNHFRKTFRINNTPSPQALELQCSPSPSRQQSYRPDFTPRLVASVNSLDDRRSNQLLLEFPCLLQGPMPRHAIPTRLDSSH